MATSSSVSDCTIVEGDSFSESSSSSAIVSLLDRLKPATPADIARKRRMKNNPPPVGKRHCRGSSTSDPKGVEPSRRVKEFPNEQLKVSAGKPFCSACQEEVGLKSSTIKKHYAPINIRLER